MILITPKIAGYLVPEFTNLCVMDDPIVRPLTSLGRSSCASSENFHEYELERTKTSDNQPLEVVSLRAFQLKRYVIAWLSATNEYMLKIGSESLPAPSYDLRFFWTVSRNKFRLCLPEIYRFKRNKYHLPEYLYSQARILFGLR
jgi:hypothetical protein